MAHHQKHYVDRPLALHSFISCDSRPAGTHEASEEDDVPDVDEPPETQLSFARLPIYPTTLLANAEQSTQRPGMSERKHSLLTQGLLTGSNLKTVAAHERLPTRAKSRMSTYSNASIASTAELTSDGGLTSPARTTTPSPPFPSTPHANLAIVPPSILDDMGKIFQEPGPLSSRNVESHHAPPAPPTVEDPPKKRITFACPSPRVANTKVEEPVTRNRPCALRFACPARPSKENGELEAPTKQRVTPQPPSRALPKHRDSDSTAKDATEDLERDIQQDYKLPTSSPEAVRSEALRFHEFASARPEEDEWISAKPTPRAKITVNDTLRKENAIRKLGEEAEKEAQEEEADQEDAYLDEEEDHINDNAEDDNYNDSDGEISDDGNETDDEEGFAASSTESEADPEYEFWTPRLTTAATSTDNFDHIRPRQARTASESSIESIANRRAFNAERNGSRKPKKFRRGKSVPKMRPGTPELPDSTDFVCGTLDEDRPLEVAYLSCLEQRKKARHVSIPQDVDPSFPTSDFEDDDDDFSGNEASDVWNPVRFEESDEGHRRGRNHAHGRKSVKSPGPSPKRYRSPPPKRRKSPAPLASKTRAFAQSPGLFAQSPRRCFSPLLRLLRSPPSSPKHLLPAQSTQGLVVPHLAQRPNLTHTKSLPRTPNPFWYEHRRSQLRSLEITAEESGDNTPANTVDHHSRGPIDIVQGLERKRQRRKEKFWRQHCRHAGKEGERRCQPGKGAERMREVGLEMADRCKGYGQRLQFVLSV